MISAILNIIDSCKTIEQLDTCSKWLDVINISHDDKLCAIGSMQLKLQQMSKFGYSKITGENRFPADDEQPENKFSIH